MAKDQVDEFGFFPFLLNIQRKDSTALRFPVNIFSV